MAKDADICRFCGEEASGYGCKYSPTHIHVKIGDATKCIFCGATSYGKSCAYNDGKTITGYVKGFHVHGHGSKKCIWCGSTDKGLGCAYSPDGKHHF